MTHVRNTVCYLDTAWHAATMSPNRDKCGRKRFLSPPGTKTAPKRRFSNQKMVGTDSGSKYDFWSFWNYMVSV